MKTPTAQEIIDLPDYWRNVDFVEWYNFRLKQLRKEDFRLKQLRKEEIENEN